MKILSIRLLGTIDIRLGERPVQGFVSSKAQALFLYLAVTRRPIQRATLATLCWGDWDERSARRSLSKALSNLRQLFGPYLQIDRHTAAFRTDQNYWLDVAAFEAALLKLPSAAPASPMVITDVQNALALYQGQFLEGFEIAHAPDFEAWARSERERLHRACCDALSALSRQMSRVQNLPQAINLTQRLLHLEPADEQAHRRLMTLYAQNGQRSSALTQYEVCREALAAELDVQPAAETVALYQALRDGTFPLDGSAGQPHTAALVDHVAPHTLLPPFPHKTKNGPLLSTPPARPAPPLVGRAGPWQQLLALWQRSVAGQTHFCLIQGEAGIGKTRLAEELLHWVVGQGATAVRTRAYAAAGELAYAPIIDWLRSPPLQRTVATLDAVWRHRIARLLPELASASPSDGAQGERFAFDNEWQRQRLFDALTHAFQAGTAPKLLLLDDLQWCDRETLAWLNYFLQASRAAAEKSQPVAPTLIVATARPEIRHESHPLIQKMDADQHFVNRSHYLILLAEGYASAKQQSDALAIVEEAIEFCESTGEQFLYAELLRLRGDYRLALGASLLNVESAYQHALTVAKEQQAKLLELRTTVSLAHLWQRQGQHKAALARLSEIYGWFTEGCNTADLRAAKALLAALKQ